MHEQTAIDESAIATVRVPGEPMGATKAWRTAALRAGCQCQDERAARRGEAQRCTRTLNGGHKLFLWTDGKVYCAKHFDDRRLGRR